MAADLAALVDDLVAETAVLHATFDGLRSEQWSLATPAAGWSVGDQVSHLAYFDVTTLQSLTDPEQFRLDASASEGRWRRLLRPYRGRVPGPGG